MFCTGSGVGSLHGWAIAAAHIFWRARPACPAPDPGTGKVLLSRMAAGDAAARDDLITHNLRLVVYLAKSTKAAVCLPRT